MVALRTDSTVYVRAKTGVDVTSNCTRRLMEPAVQNLHMNRHIFDCFATKLPPSIGTTVPVTHFPPFPLNQRHAAMTSSGLPMRCIGKDPAISFSNESSVAAIILDLKGPSARVLTVMEGPSCPARCFDSLPG